MLNLSVNIDTHLHVRTHRNTRSKDLDILRAMVETKTQSLEAYVCSVTCMPQMYYI